jgi:glycosyltransferase involved in cell wall biosynthesis
MPYQGKVTSKNKRQSLLSVVIPAKNNLHHLKVAIVSVLKQDYPCQVIVVDDGSSPSLVSSLNKDYPQVKVIRNKESKGPAAARNQGSRQAKGDFIAFLDSDDYWQPNFAKMMVSACKESDGTVICFSSKVYTRRFGFKGRIIFCFLSAVKDLMLSLILVFNRGTLLPSGFYLAQISHMVFSRKAIQGIKFDESYQFGEDWKFIIEVQKKTKIKIFPQKLLFFRYHEKSLSFKNKKKWFFYLRLVRGLNPRLRKSVLVKFFLAYINLFSRLL